MILVLIKQSEMVHFALFMHNPVQRKYDAKAAHGGAASRGR